MSQSLRRNYSDYERQFIADNHVKLTAPQLAKALGRELISIKNYLRRNRIRKGFSGSKFPKGNVPWNKGLKGWVPKGSEKGQFQKGHTPHNAANYYDGIVVTRCKKGERPYRYRRLAPNKWILSHRYNYELLHGPIPAGSLLRCLDGDTLNDAAANWELVTKQENATRNAIYSENRASTCLSDNYVVGTLTKGKPALRDAVAAMPDLIQAQRLRITLNRTIGHVLETQAR